MKAGVAMTFSTDSTLAIDAIVAFAAHAPSAVALEQQDARRDYESLIAAADALASRLAAAGVKPGAVVAVCLPRGIAQVTALLAAWRVGAAYCPLDPAWPEARLEALVADLAAAAIVTAIDGIAEIGRASCRERVWMSGVAVSRKKKSGEEYVY